MGFKNLLREYFTFNRRERNGVFVLLCIILGLILYLSFSDLFFTSEKTDFSKFAGEVSAFEAEQKRISDSIADARADMKFSGNSLYDERDDHSRQKKYSEHANSKFKYEVISVEINSADTTELKRIKGIGSVFAKRIVKYRAELGGFFKKEQLLEVFGMDQEKYDQILTQITLDTLIVKKLNINAASVEDLNLHPYVSKKEAVAIFTKRVKTGDYLDIQEVKKITLMSDSAFLKVAPYLSAE